jgi:hypothetical protein
MARADLLTYTDPERRITRAQWAKWENVGLDPDLDLDGLVLNWPDSKVADLQAKGALVALTMERTIEGASTLTMTLRDPNGRVLSERAGRMRERVDPTTAAIKAAYKRTPVEVDQGWDPLLPPDLLGRAMEVSIDGVVFRLVAIRYTSATEEIELTFEDRLVYWLRRKKGAKRASRDNITRALFILALLREVRAASYRYVCPELNQRQPVDKPASGTGTTTPRGELASGVPTALNRIYPRHRLGTPGATRLSELQVRAAAEYAGFNPRDALHMAQIAHGESDFYPGVVQDDPGDGMVGHGLWQMTPNAWGGASSPTYRHMDSLGGLDAMRNPLQAARQAKWMHEQSGFRPWYGTRYLDLGSGAGIKSVLRAGAEADATSSAEGKAAAKGAQSRSYQFTRNTDEDSWTAMQRLAGEVNWRCFVVGRSLYYMSEAELYGRRARYQVSPDDPAVIGLDYNVDWGKAVSEATLTVALDRWGASPGSVVLLDGFGPPDGRWLVATVRRDWFAPTAEVTLKQPGKAKLEPADPNTQRASNAIEGGGGEATDMDAGTKAGRVYAAAKAISDKGYPYVWGGGHARAGTPDGGTGRDPGIGYDCSGSCCAALAAAGLGYTPGGKVDVSGTMAASWGQAGRGRQFTVWANGQHVWIQFHEIGAAWRFDTSPYGSGERGPRMRSTQRPTGGFTARHWPGV